MNDTEIQAVIKGICDRIVKDGRDIACKSPIFEYLIDNSSLFKNPKAVSAAVVNPFLRIVAEAGKQISETESDAIGQLYTHYSFFLGNIAELCVRKYGSQASVDRAGWVIGRYAKQCMGQPIGEMPDVSEREYYHPPSGTTRQWVDFAGSLSLLIFGKPDRYIAAYVTLLGQAK